MEAAGFAIGLVGLAGLFSSCVDAVARAHTYKSFSSDSQALDLQFSATKLRLETWGRAVGFAGAGAVAAAGDDAPLHHPALDDERIQRATVEIFGFVEQLCEEATRAGRLRLDTAADSSASRDPRMKPSGCGARRKLSWAMGGRLRRTEKLELFKELVQTLYNLVPPDDYEAGRPVASAWSTEFGQIMSRLEARARQDVHAWLRPIPGERYHDSLQRRLDGTCVWMLNESLFQQWMTSELSPGPSILWLHGPAGFGKTIMCANIIQHLTTTLTTPTAHFFFSSDASSSRDDPFLAIRSWVSQVISTHDGAFQLALERQECDPDPIATRHTIMSVFESIACLVPGCTFVLDGLDECTNIDGGGRDSVVVFLDAVMKALAGAKARLLVVSRFLAEIQHSLRGDEPERLREYKLRPSHVQADIAAYSRDVVEKKLQNKNTALRASLSNTMAERCEGQFLWIRLQGDSLRRGMSKKQLEDAVKDTPTNLERVYDHSWTRITQLKDADRTRAFALLRWAAFAQRPLTVVEVVEAVLVEETQQCDVDDLIDEIDEDYVETEIMGLCGPLLEVKTDVERCGHCTLHLPHFTVRQYLAGRLTTPGWVRSSQLHGQATREMLHHTFLAEVCIRYLDLPQVWARPLDSACRAPGSAFRDYAASFWYYHTKSGVASDPTLMQVAMEFCHSENARWISWRTLRQMASGNKTSPAGPVLSALRLGVPELALCLLKNGQYSADDLDFGRTSAFKHACAFGLTSVIEAMIGLGADPCFIDTLGTTPLSLASGSENIEAVKILLQNNASARVPSKADGSALYQASRYGPADIVQLLLENHAVDTINDTVREEVTPLHVACMNGHADIVRLLLSHGADASKRCSTHQTAFGLAVYNGFAEIVRMFLECGASAEGSDDDNFYPVHLAAQSGHLDLLHLLISHGADVTARSNTGRTALYLAAAGGEMAVVKTLVEMGVDVNARDQFGHTALVASADIGHLETVTYLLAHGACCHAVSRRGGTALSAAVRSNNAGVVRAILQHSSLSASSECHKPRQREKPTSDEDLDALSGNSDMADDRLVLEPAQMVNIMNTHYGRGNAPIHLAAHHNNLELFELLLDHGADMNAIQADGITALHTIVQLNYLDLAKSLLRRGVNADGGTVHKAIHYAVMEGRTEMVKLLLDSGVGIESTDALGNTALGWAAKNGNTDLIRLLLDRGADHAAVNVNGTTALHIVSQNGHTDCVRLLLEHGANPAAADSIGITPLHFASRHGHPDAVRLLLRHGANMRATCHNRSIPLANAAYYGQVDVVKVLIEHNASFEAADNASPPLRVAVSQGHAAVVKLLLDAGAAVDATEMDESPQTPLHTAVIAGRVDIVQMLLEKGADVTRPLAEGPLPLYSAASHGHLEVTRALLDAGADVSAAGGHPVAGWPALFIAVHSDHEAVTRLLLERGADGNFASQDGNSPLQLAVRKSHTSIVKLLLENGADASGANTANVLRPLCVATWNGQIDIMKLLLGHGADPMAPSMNGLRPLDHAAETNNLEAMETLVKSRPGAAWAAEKRARSLVHRAARSGHVDMFRLFLEHGVCAAPHERAELLHIAARYDRDAIIEALIAVAGIPSVEVDCRDEMQRTPLLLAARAGRLQAVWSLVRAGARLDTADWKGWTPLTAAEQCGRRAVAACLKRHQAEGDAQSMPGSFAPDGDDEVAADEAAERGLAYCDSCLRDVPDDSGQQCARCGDTLFYLCAECFGKGGGCIDPVHEFWPLRDAAATRVSAEAVAA
ncbi:hypothetical protein D7B24_007001 [Verticillium nonalfalfae]|uniref:Uncharacterized protein n=1 Tax=Verticillium nonalfalfae TaxID=1051616 RepID=A0A3M9Y819_9PEZI|nr:uncharacterized protein D7B24_007001 [Verticillium nonalfalfae]RNJ56637.1 hypothetical protein D7B24_007001 [Verticillium nonalfalfae]